jgi:hypothetical protein
MVDLSLRAFTETGFADKFGFDDDFPAPLIGKPACSVAYPFIPVVAMP